MKVKDILKIKGSQCECIKPNQTIKEAVNLIINKKIGALPVMENENIIGIITERDILRLLAGQNASAFEKPVREFMTKNLVVGVPDDDIDVAMAYMTNNRFRHLPIIDDSRLVGIISIGDVVKAEVSNLKVENRYLTDYITGKYPG